MRSDRGDALWRQESRWCKTARGWAAILREVQMHPRGSRGIPGSREIGLVQELRIEDAVHNLGPSFEIWDLRLYDKVCSCLTTMEAIRARSIADLRTT